MGLRRIWTGNAGAIFPDRPRSMGCDIVVPVLPASDPFGMPWESAGFIWREARFCPPIALSDSWTIWSAEEGLKRWKEETEQWRLLMLVRKGRNCAIAEPLYPKGEERHPKCAGKETPGRQRCCRPGGMDWKMSASAILPCCAPAYLRCLALADCGIRDRAVRPTPSRIRRTAGNSAPSAAWR